MAEFRPVSAQRSDWGLFSSEELRDLMQIEFERSQRYGYELACMAMAVDRLGHLHDLYGYASKEEIQDSLQGLLKSATRDSDFPRCLVDDYLLALFPHTSPEGAVVLAKRLLKSARQLKFESDGRPLQITLSIGLSGSSEAVAGTFEQMVQRAQAGLGLARAGGGDRWRRAEQANGDLDQIKRELDDLRRILEEKGRFVEEAREVEELLAQSAAPGQSGLLLERPEDQSLAARLEALFAGTVAGGDPQLRQAVIELALRGVHEERARASERKLEESEREVDILQRRVNKLAGALAATEAELRRVMDLKNVDPGVASIYRTVQGLSADAEQASRKLEMLNRLYQANIDLHRRLKPQEP